MFQLSRRVRDRILRARFVLPSVFAVMAFVFGTPVSAHAGYLLQPGDVVELSVAGQPELRQRMPVQLDGTVAAPLIGRVAAAGTTAAALQDLLETAYTTRLLMDGKTELPVLLGPGDVSVVVVEYRPVYVNGDVLNPGQLAFRPSMTVRHAVAMSGGYSTDRSRQRVFRYDPVELERDRESLELSLIKEQVLLERLMAQRDGRATLDAERIRGSLAHEAAFEDFVRNETELLEVHAAEFESELAFLQDGISQAERRIAVLQTQQEQERSASQEEAREHERTVDLVKKGTVTWTRGSESRRALREQMSRQMDTRIELERAQIHRDELRSKLVKLETQRRSGLLREIVQSRAAIAELRLKIRAVSEKLQLSGKPLAEAAIDIAIVRKQTGRWDRVPASEDAELQPGDVVEVTIRSPAGARTGTSEGAEPSTLPTPGSRLSILENSDLF